MLSYSLRGCDVEYRDRLRVHRIGRVDAINTKDMGFNVAFNSFSL